MSLLYQWKEIGSPMKRQPTALDCDIARLIDKRLKAIGMTRAELARRLDVHPARVTNILHGAESNLTVESIANIAAAMNCVPVVAFEPNP